MEAPTARPRAQPKTAPPSAPARKSTRKRDDAVRDLPVITVRLDADTIARLDAVVERREAELRAQGGHTSRGAVAALALREFIERDEARAAATREPSA